MTTTQTQTPGTTTLAAVGDAATVEAPTVFRPYRAAAGIDVIPGYLPVPGMGVLPANSFVVHGTEPGLVDAGPGGAADAFGTALQEVIDPAELRWLWLTHTDPDHVGALAWLLDAAPRLRVITTFLAAGKLGMHLPVPLDRLHWCNPGEQVTLGDRTLVGIRPPSYDAPETVAAFDPGAGVLFSADSFGALLRAPVAEADEIAADDLGEGLTLWSTVDAPWLGIVDRQQFGRTVADMARLAPSTILSAHLPPARGLTDTLLGHIARVPDADPWRGPDQAALEQILAQVQGS